MIEVLRQIKESLQYWAKLGGLALKQMPRKFLKKMCHRPLSSKSAHSR
jgi:hypothetical protein